MARLTGSDQSWQKRMDADTLAEANVIKEDPTRLKGAKQAAKQLATDAEEKADAMKSVAKNPKDGSTSSSSAESSNKPTRKLASRVPVNSLIAGIPGVRKGS